MTWNVLFSRFCNPFESEIGRPMQTDRSERADSQFASTLQSVISKSRIIVAVLYKAYLSRSRATDRQNC